MAHTVHYRPLKPYGGRFVSDMGHNLNDEM